MLKIIDVDNIDWKKVNNMLPVIIQHSISNEVLMHGFMDKSAFKETQKKNYVTFYSRTKKRLWTKGETSGNYLKVVNMFLDCDKDVLLILVISEGNTCHLNYSNCFKSVQSNLTFFYHFEKLLESKKVNFSNASYTSRLHSMGINRISQKVGEEAIETVIAAIKKDRKELIEEASDLMYHFLVLLHHCDLDFSSIITNLKERKNYNDCLD
ncbi:phosphoribosyl-ATP pyrophosphatase [Buchnera aphidicola (Schlechtendalia chinensis)]|uniref:Histidine biosynthesis bifunctional protein HisIE n=1 Tax=Buchnera aphidicola subsp. Schlechtendalia chinensis TaxID=118110 RepID=A0A172WD73_BUCSC|nr:bifunctional phosphoribosyl-AMP cyclohydrolase/phosphoribosyl-ATP diphosphatase HisIE [Buchnera aphidicola]ANF16914.1 phosphoribosyl-ATP pyrophosphatase [Buchnera aphidicola (Schlechtendalia chinensis)]